MSDSPFSDDALDPPADPSQLDEWLRSRLDHRVTIVLLAPPQSDPTMAERALAAAVTSYTELRLRVEQCPAPEDALAVERMLLEVERLSPDVLVVEQGGASETWPRVALRVADRLGLCDRAFVALIGSAVTRQDARRLGFEDGFSLDTPAAALVRALAREAVTRDELRRHGSSPPCYL